MAAGETVAGMVNAATGGLGLGLEVGVGMGTSMGVGSGMMATPGVMVGKIVGVGFCPQAKGSKKPRNTRRKSLPTSSPLFKVTRRCHTSMLRLKVRPAFHSNRYGKAKQGE